MIEIILIEAIKEFKTVVFLLLAEALIIWILYTLWNKEKDLLVKSSEENTKILKDRITSLEEDLKKEKSDLKEERKEHDLFVDKVSEALIYFRNQSNGIRRR